MTKSNICDVGPWPAWNRQWTEQEADERSAHTVQEEMKALVSASIVGHQLSLYQVQGAFDPRMTGETGGVPPLENLGSN